MLSVESISKSYNSLLFEDVSFTLGNDEKVGLVGLNGCGKTTLFKIIAGVEDVDEGIVRTTGESVATLPQEFSFSSELLVGEFLEDLVEEPSTEMYKVEMLLSTLGLRGIDHYSLISKLSDGQQMKLYLAGILMGYAGFRQDARENTNVMHGVHEPILLLDEPTNHLDIEGIVWLEAFLNQYGGVAIVISHDRAFLNAVTEKIFEIDECTLHVYEGNYDDYLLEKAKRIELRRKEYVKQEKKREQLEELLHRASKIGDGKKRGRAMGAARKRIYREVEKGEVDLYQKKQIKEFSISGAVHSTKKMLDVKNISFEYEKDTPVLIESSLCLLGGEKVWLYGPNGSGKTTFIKLLIGALLPREGEIHWGNDVSFAYFSQNQEHLPMDREVAEFFMEQTGTPFEKSFGALNRFLFDKTQRELKIGSLSPGQRARLSFAVFAQQDYDFLILDEPTNHLDIETKELIEDALNSFGGNILLISHDRYFVDHVGPGRAISIIDGVLSEG